MIKLPFSFYIFLINYSLFRNGIKIKKIISENELREIQRFIFDIYKTEGYIDQDFFSEQVLKDEFDKYSIYFSAFVHKKVVGAVRIIFHSPIGLQLEKFFNISCPFHIEREKIAEISRLCVNKDYPRKSSITFGLLKECFKESMKRGIEYWYTVTSFNLVSKLKKFNIQFLKLPCKEPTPVQIKAREPHKGFFEKNSPEPYLISLNQIKKEFRL